MCLCAGKTLAQNSENKLPKIKWGLTTQIWARYSDLNVGSTINGEATSNYTDVSIRRLRIPVSSQISPKVYVAAMFGGNNFNDKSKDFPLYVLDLYLEYKFNKAIEVGLGKSGWVGLNRWALRSSKTLMGLDAPLFTLNTVDKNDDLARNLGIWFKGQINQFDYRLIFNNPIVITAYSGNGRVDFANNRPRVKTSAYVKYQFFEHESNKGSYQAGTYMQAKKVWNIGAGFQYQEKAMSDGDVTGPLTNIYDSKHWAVDSFLNIPLENNDAITAYLGYYDFDFGKDYIRNVSANGSMFGGGDNFNGAGVGFPMIGTGDSVYFQFGYAFQETKILSQNMIIQPNISVQHSNWEALNEPMTVYDFTVNFMMDGHGNKLSLGYQYRPIFDSLTLKEKDRKGMAVLQYQISMN